MLCPCSVIPKRFPYFSLQNQLYNILKTKFQSHIHSPPTQQQPHSSPWNIIGLRFHTRYCWLPHIKEVKANYPRAMNVPKYVSHLKIWCSRKVLLSLYQALICSRLDHCASIYGIISPSQLALIDSIQTSAIRKCTGVCRTSPALSLCADVGLPPTSSPSPVFINRSPRSHSATPIHPNWRLHLQQIL